MADIPSKIGTANKAEWAHTGFSFVGNYDCQAIWYVDDYVRKMV